ncbi:MAG: hypothetical protein M1508_04360 [Nitrospirae bacterium]|nr:hypothetical protein [Nitrospirota bacterium]
MKRFIRKGKRLYEGRTGLRSPFSCFRIPGTFEHDGLRLRPLRIIDIPLVRKGLRDKDVLRTTGPGKPLSGECLSVWWWLKKTYTILLCIEVESTCVGFIGLYNLKPGESAEITLAIFDRGMRRHEGSSPRQHHLRSAA